MSSPTPATRVERHDSPCAQPRPEARAGPGRAGPRRSTTPPDSPLLPSLRDELAVTVPADRGPGRDWHPAASTPHAAGAADQASAPVIRIGYARCSHASQDLASQLTALAQAGCARVFSEKISTRVKVRPELEGALRLTEHDARTVTSGPRLSFL